jgi:hypothetical protein
MFMYHTVIFRARSEICGSHGGEDDDVVVLGCDAEDGDSMFLRNVGVYVGI